jgi:putative sterol carrier protein
MSSPQQVFDDLDQQLRTDPSRTAGLRDSFAFVISGETGGTWWVEANDGVGKVHAGEAEVPSVTIKMSDETFVGLADGSIDGGEAFFDGLITAEGDQNKMYSLGQLFGGAG